MNSTDFDTSQCKCSLEHAAVRAILEQLQTSSKKDHTQFALKMLPYLFNKLIGRNPSFSHQYYKMKALSLQFSPEHGVIAYNMARAIHAKRIVEFGTSFGFSTIFLAAAIKDNGGGVVIGSEFVDEKVTRAQANLKAAGLDQYTDIRPGDAMQSLADPGGDVDMILIDGSKDLYIPILKVLFPFLRKRGVVLADNVCSPFVKKSLASYVAYVQNLDNGFMSMTIPLPDGFEFSVKL
ncbi:MAG: methyltransferase [Desulfobacterium sp.]|nr:methyltransferase [Desulfobacteraceae bacterium]MBA3037793.1 methyltransferase [Desulfobacterium sp.]